MECLDQPSFNPFIEFNDDPNSFSELLHLFSPMHEGMTVFRREESDWATSIFTIRGKGILEYTLEAKISQDTTPKRYDNISNFYNSNVTFPLLGCTSK